MEQVAVDSVVLVVMSTATILGLTSLVAVYLGRRTKSSDDWVVGGRQLPFYVVVGSYYATQMGGGMLVAHVGLAYAHGWSALTYGLIGAIGVILFAVAAPWLRRQRFSTLPDVLGRFYGDSRLLRGFAAVVCLVLPFGWLCTQLVAFAKLFTVLTGIAMPVLMVAIAAVALLFVLPGGLKSVAWTDFVFGCLMLVMAGLSGAYALDLAGGWHHVRASVPPTASRFPEGLWSVGTYSVVLWALAIFPSSLTNQMNYQRVFAIRNVSRVRMSLVASVVVMISMKIWAVVVGMSLRTAQPGLAPEMAAGWFLTQVEPWFLALYVGFVAATIVSTVDSAIQSVAVSVTRDIYQTLVNPQAEDARVLRISRFVSIAVTVVALVWGIAWPEALGWLVATYAYSAAALLFPLLLGYILRGKDLLTAEGAIAAMVAGIAGCAAAQGADTSIPYAAYGLGASLLALCIGSWVTRRLRTIGRGVNPIPQSLDRASARRRSDAA